MDSGYCTELLEEAEREIKELEKEIESLKEQNEHYARTIQALNNENKFVRELMTERDEWKRRFMVYWNWNDRETGRNRAFLKTIPDATEWFKD